jgi:DNA-binding NarL/FixJ family response regulator
MASSSYWSRNGLVRNSTAPAFMACTDSTTQAGASCREWPTNSWRSGRSAHAGQRTGAGDVRLPGLSGPDLQRDLMKSGAPIPIIFLTGHGDLSLLSGAARCAPTPRIAARDEGRAGTASIGAALAQGAIAPAPCGGWAPRRPGEEP